MPSTFLAQFLQDLEKNHLIFIFLQAVFVKLFTNVGIMYICQSRESKVRALLKYEYIPLTRKAFGESRYLPRPDTSNIVHECNDKNSLKNS